MRIITQNNVGDIPYGNIALWVNFRPDRTCAVIGEMVQGGTFPVAVYSRREYADKAMSDLHSALKFNADTYKFKTDEEMAAEAKEALELIREAEEADWKRGEE